MYTLTQLFEKKAYGYVHLNNYWYVSKFDEVIKLFLSLMYLHNDIT